MRLTYVRDDDTRSRLMWSLRKGDGPLFDTAHRTRDGVRLWASERFLPADEYSEICERSPGFGVGHQLRMALWAAVKKRHPQLRIVRVQVSAL